MCCRVVHPAHVFQFEGSIRASAPSTESRTTQTPDVHSWRGCAPARSFCSMQTDEEQARRLLTVVHALRIGYSVMQGLAGPPTACWLVHTFCSCTHPDTAVLLCGIADQPLCAAPKYRSKRHRTPRPRDRSSKLGFRYCRLLCRKYDSKTERLCLVGQVSTRDLSNASLFLSSFSRGAAVFLRVPT